MAVKASITVTISKYRDCDSITRYFRLQASTAAAPAIPTTLTPSSSDWSTTEPTYTSGSTNTLYYTDKYVFSDGTFQYTDDGNGKAIKSSSYEAAKEAYNKAQAAQNTANTTQENLNNLQINTGNLLFNGQDQKPDSSQWGNNNLIFSTDDLPESIYCKFKHKGNNATKYRVPFNIDKIYELSVWLKGVNSSDTSSTYPSIWPVDIDDNIINADHVCEDSMKKTYTTLTQDLHSGDTIVYADDLSNWTTVKYDYNTRIGFYDYHSNNGQLYDNYTRHCVDFCAYGDNKTDYINKTNNTITLKTAYNGPTVLAGTKIAQHRYGNTYIYPFGSLKASENINWTNYSVKFGVIFGSSNNKLYQIDIERLKIASYIRFFTYDDKMWYSGLQLLDITNDEELNKGLNNLNTNINSRIDDTEGMISDLSGKVDTKIDAATANDIAQDKLNSFLKSSAWLEISGLNGAIRALTNSDDGTYQILEQKDNEWTFQLGKLFTDVKTAVEDLTKTKDQLDGSEESALSKRIDQLDEDTKYIKMTTYEGQPAIILGMENSPFQVRITNTAMEFVESGNVIAYVNNGAFYNTVGIVREEIKIVNNNQGFSWKTRSNGNLGLQWVEET